MMRIAGLPVWGPSDVIAGARAVLGWTDEAVGLAAALPQRLATLLDDVDELVARIGAVSERIERMVQRADGIMDDTEGVVRGVEPLLTEVRTVADGASGLVAHAAEVAAGAAMLVARADGVAEEAAGLVSRAGTVSDGAAALVARASLVTDSASEVVTGAGSVTGRAEAVVTDAAGASRGAGELLALYQPIAHRAAPLAKRFVDELSDAEVEAAIKLVDQVPQFTEHMETDIMPILATLDRVGPDVHELLDVLKDVRMAIQGVPGFKLLRRRGERGENADS